MSLITNISQIRAASTINISNTLANWQPYIDEAEETFIRPAIGSEFFDELDEVVNGSASGDSQYDDLLVKIRTALALYSLWLGADEMSISISAAGFQVVSSDTHKPTAEYQNLNVKESWLQRAHRHLDLALKYLDENQDTFTGYTPAENECFIVNAADFQQYVDINSSRRVFLQLIPVMKSVEKKYIKATLGEDFYNELKETFNVSGSSEISDDDQAVIDLIKPALAHLTIARALQEITLDILNWGAFVHAWSTFKSMRRMDEANRERVAAMIEANKIDGEAELKELQQFLDDNAGETKYATYYESDLYQGPTYSITKNQFENSADNAIFVP